ncbi:MAG: methyltransferase [Peptococcaceae bacterium BICA1-7]|nr:MAG: methyltransferase [Peptococcaceae bacterium BICA1-7]HBV96456.1 class I SAM-dependent methyltransferase [Desulfotomaculum sp.]
MKENQVSSMALWTTYFRAYHATHDEPKIFDDFLAWGFFNEEERTSLGQQMMNIIKAFNPAYTSVFPDQATALAWLMQTLAGTPITLSRAKYTEEILEKTVRQGVRQYVILGAGMDTFAFRRKELVEQLQIFEIDHPATQDFKRNRITELGWEIPEQLHFVPVDFTKDSFSEALKRSPYDPQALTFFSWLGVSYYLPQDVVFAMLKTIAKVSPTGSLVIFDYLDKEAFVPEKAAPRVQGMLGFAQQKGEIMIAGFEPSTLAAELDRLGLRLEEDLSPWDIEVRHFMGRTDFYHACEHAHFACAVVK